MIKSSVRNYWHSLFEFGIVIKAFNGLWETINGLWETITGFLFLFLSKAALDQGLLFIFRNELLEDPRDKLINFFLQALQSISNDAKIFAAFYVLSHGLLNIFLAIQLYRDRHWAYLVMIDAMLFFIPYQIYRISIHHSAFLIALTVFDILFVILTWHEYKYHRERQNKYA